MRTIDKMTPCREPGKKPTRKSTIRKRWKRARKAQLGDYNVVDGKVPKWVAVLRFIGVPV